MLNKGSIQLLMDYLADRKDIRLSLFIGSINPQFKLLKANKAQFEMLMADYERDKSPLRLKNLESFLLGGNPGKVKKEKVVIKAKGKLTALMSPIKDEETIQLLKLQDSLGQLRQQYSVGIVPMDVMDRISKLKAEIEVIETKRGNCGIDPEAQEKTELSFIYGILGDWETEGTIANQIVNGALNQVRFTSPFNPEYLLELLSKHSQTKLKNYTVINLIGSAANTGKLAKGSTWEITDPSQGQPSPRFLQQTKDGNTIRALAL